MANNANKTLYDKIGGDLGIHIMMEQLLEDSVDNPSFLLFFQDASVSSLVSHQIRFFRLVLGPEDKRPDTKRMTDHILRAHSRLFRKAGLNEEHFDFVVNSFVKGMQSMQTDQRVIDECAACLLPLREVFAYGATVAKHQNGDSKAKRYPNASADTMAKGQVRKLQLEEEITIEIARWLPEAVEKFSRQTNLRSWTAAIASAYGEDALISDTFLAMRHLSQYPYLVALLHLAFRPDEEKTKLQHCIDIVKYPLGKAKDKAVCLRLWNRMVWVFGHVVCESSEMQMRTPMAVKTLQANLTFYSADCFPNRPYVHVGGLQSPHCLASTVTDDHDSSSSLYFEDSTTETRSKDKKKHIMYRRLKLTFSKSSNKQCDVANGVSVKHLLQRVGLFRKMTINE